MTDIRPHGGFLRFRDGREMAVRFVPTGDPSRFLAVTVDGDPIVVDAHAVLVVDMIGPGQAIIFGSPR
jgi:acyl dehydratase